MQVLIDNGTRFFIPSQIKGKGVHQNSHFLKVKVLENIYMYFGKYEIVDRLLDISQRSILSSGTNIGIPEDWTPCDAQEILSYENGQTYNTQLEAGYCKRATGGCSAVAGLLAWCSK